MTEQDALAAAALNLRLTHPPLALAPIRGHTDRRKIVNMRTGLDTNVRVGLLDDGLDWAVFRGGAPLGEKVYSWADGRRERFEPFRHEDPVAAINRAVRRFKLDTRTKPVSQPSMADPKPDPHTYKEAVERLGGRDWVKLANNTYLQTRGLAGVSDQISVRLHATDVVTYYDDGGFEIRHGGWQTMVTKDRINRFLPKWMYVDGRTETSRTIHPVGDWSVAFRNRPDVYHFENSIRIGPRGARLDRK